MLYIQDFLAAGAQSAFGNVTSGSAFAFLQSAGARGVAAMTAEAVAQGTGLAVAAAGAANAGWRLVKAKL